MVCTDATRPIMKKRVMEKSETRGTTPHCSNPRALLRFVEIQGAHFKEGTAKGNGGLPMAAKERIEADHDIEGEIFLHSLPLSW